MADVARRDEQHSQRTDNSGNHAGGRVRVGSTVEGSDGWDATGRRSRSDPGASGMRQGFVRPRQGSIKNLAARRARGFT